MELCSQEGDSSSFRGDSSSPRLQNSYCSQGGTSLLICYNHRTGTVIICIDELLGKPFRGLPRNVWEMEKSWSLEATSIISMVSFGLFCSVHSQFCVIHSLCCSNHNVIVPSITCVRCSIHNQVSSVHPILFHS